jgi:hypothetical protein
MIAILSTVVSLLSFLVRSRASLELELIALRHQVMVLRRQRPRRLRLFLIDRLFWVCLYRARPQLLDTLVLVKPATVIGWHRKGFRVYWRWRSRRSGRSKTSVEIRDLIRRMSVANPLWGAPRIHGELLKLGVDISQATVDTFDAAGHRLIDERLLTAVLVLMQTASILGPIPIERFAPRLLESDTPPIGALRGSQHSIELFEMADEIPLANAAICAAIIQENMK